MAKDQVYVCPECAAIGWAKHPLLFWISQRCSQCRKPLQGECWTVPGAGIGLLGDPGSGKTTFVKALHRELMRCSPNWSVSTSESTFEHLTSCDFDGGTVSARYFMFHVARGDSKCSLLMWDPPGRVCVNFAADSQVKTQNSSMFPGGAAEVESLMLALSRCDSLILIVGAHAWDKNSGIGPSAEKEDVSLTKMVRRLVKIGSAVKRVTVVLAGVDRLADNPDIASVESRQIFEEHYPLLPGTLANAGIDLSVSPVSNFGFHRDASLNWRPFGVLQVFQTAMKWEDEPKSLEIRSLNRVGTTSFDKSGKVFISYRRDHGADTARLIRNELGHKGWTTFLDVEDLGACKFDDRLLWEIRNSQAFVIVLSDGSLDRCAEPDDWLRREIAEAIRHRRTIVPIIKEGFFFQAGRSTEEAALAKYNGVPYSHVYFDKMVERICEYIEVASI